MNRKKFYLRTLAVTGILLFTLLFSACHKSDVNNNTNQQSAGLMAFNLVPDKAVAITIGGNTLPGSPLSFNSYTGAYLSIYPGTRTITSFDYASNTSLATASDSFAVNKYYSVFVVGTTGAYQNVIVQDEFDSLSVSQGQSYIRYINAINGSVNPTVAVSSNGTNVVNAPAPFASVSGFTAVAPGDITITVSNGTNLNINRTIYTILLTSGAISSDPAQIKFIVNGTLDNSVSGQRISSSAKTIQSK
jgi:hypothetical protein